MSDPDYSGYVGVFEGYSNLPMRENALVVAAPRGPFKVFIKRRGRSERWFMTMIGAQGYIDLGTVDGKKARLYAETFFVKQLDGWRACDWRENGN